MRRTRELSLPALEFRRSVPEGRATPARAAAVS